MLKGFFRWFTPLAVLGFFWLPMAYAQRGRIQVEEPPTTQSFALAYTVAFLATIIVLVILCAPSRKAWRD